MQPTAFLQQLAARGLSLQVAHVDDEIKLRLSGKTERVTDRIRQYISANRQSLIDCLGQLRYVPCHLVEYGLCSNQVIEQDESTWRMSPGGLIFCVRCWESRNIERAGLAAPYLVDHNQPADLETRIERIMSGPGYTCCGGHNWFVSEDGFLVCQCLLEKLAEGARIDKERAREEARRKREIQEFQTAQPVRQRWNRDDAA